MSTEISVDIAVDIACIATSVGERKAILAETKSPKIIIVEKKSKSGTTIDCVSTECRRTIDRLSTTISTEGQSSIDPVSTKYRPSVNRLSTECRPTID